MLSISLAPRHWCSGRMMGMPAADARLKQQLDPVFAGQLQQLGALLGDQLLVGGDDALAALQAAS